MLAAAELKALLSAHGLRLTKRLGQHHLIDARLIRRIVERCRLSPHDTVVEIGAGLGALTEPLAERAGRVIAVEVDRKIAALLADRARAWPNVAVVHQDILTFSWRQLTDVVVVGAIPYHITSLIIAQLSDVRGALRRAVLIVQTEVAQRLVAKPGTKAYSRLSVLGQYGWEIAPVLPIPRSAFFPQPSVDSRCLELTPRERPAADVQDEPLFFEVVKTAFSQRRKTLVNCLSNVAVPGVSRQALASILEDADLAASVRGETLSLEQFAYLTNALARANVLQRPLASQH